MVTYQRRPNAINREENFYKLQNVLVIDKVLFLNLAKFYIFLRIIMK